MKVTDVSVLPINLRWLALLEVLTDEGIVGIGITQSPGNIIAAILNAGLRDLVIGEDPRDVPRIWRKMFIEWQAQRGRGAEGGLAINAMAAIDMALWDISGKAKNEPVNRLFGSTLKDKIMAYASATAYLSECDAQGNVTRKSAEQLAEEAAGFVKNGFKAVKYGWGNHFAPEDEERLAAIRQSIGSDIKLMIDVGCPAYWSVEGSFPEVIDNIRQFEKYDLYFVEEPLPPSDVNGFAELTQKTSNIRIASGESLSTVPQFEQFIQRRALDIVQPDAAQMGITQMLEVARAAEQAELLCIPHSPWAAVIVAAHVHILSAVTNGPMVEYPAFTPLNESAQPLWLVTEIMHSKITEQMLTLEDGYVRVPASPGLGLGNYVPEEIDRLQSIIKEKNL